MKFINAEEVAGALPMQALIASLEAAFAHRFVAPPRHQHLIRRDGYRDSTLLLMPAWTDAASPRPYIAVKLMALVPSDDARSPHLDSSVLLYDGAKGGLLAVMDGNAVTARRTVATSVLAARYLARSASENLLIVGAGRVARLLHEGYRTAFPIRRVEVWDINEAWAARLVADLRSQGVDAALAADLEQAARAADIITSATRSTVPRIEGRWLRPGVHLDLIGSFTPQMRECDDEAFLRSSIFVDTPKAVSDSGDLAQPIEAGLADTSHIKGTLAELCSGALEGRTATDQITLFKTIGSAIADLAAAKLVYEARP